jgi:ATP-dependent DNA helicase RecQ
MATSKAKTAERRVRQTARERLGMDTLRPGQEDAVTSILSGRDTLVVMPTGSGKSAIYQIAGYLLDGPTVVVSPLGDLEFLFLAPEQLQNDETMAQLVAAKPSLIVVDDAHSISEWGHDFRPDYLRLGSAIEALGHPATLALTATAAPPVQTEIVERLNMRDPAILVRGFDRPNIRFAVRPFEDADEKRAALIAYILDAAKLGIVYAATRKHTEEIAGAIVEAGCAAVAYHAGLTAAERNRVQSAFAAKQASTRQRPPRLPSSLRASTAWCSAPASK